MRPDAKAAGRSLELRVESPESCEKVNRSSLKKSTCLLGAFLATAVAAMALENPAAQAQGGDTIFINEYRVNGASKLPRRTI